MFRLSERSLSILKECDMRLQKITFELLKTYNISVLEGYRDKETQDNYFNKGLSKLRFPKSKHNQKPSKAIHLVPYPIDWGESDNAHHNTIALSRFYFMAGKINEIARVFGYTVRWGGDWDSDNDFFDQTFNDLSHFELID